MYCRLRFLLSRGVDINGWLPTHVGLLLLFFQDSRSLEVIVRGHTHYDSVYDIELIYLYCSQN